MEITLELNEEMSAEIVEAARACQCPSPRQFAVEAIEACLATRRLPRVDPAPYGGRTTGTSGHGQQSGHDEEFETPADAGIVEHKILL
jgi:hypothetical protein